MTSPPVTSMLLIRHAESADSARQVCHGTLDIPLSSGGVVQADRISNHLEDAKFDAVYASPRRRAVATAAAVAAKHGLEPIPREDLAEIDFGAFEGRTFDEIAASHPELYAQWMSEPASMRFPGGESFGDLRARVTSEIARIRREHRGGSVAVVTHGGVIRAVLADVLGLNNEAIFRIDQTWGGMTFVEYVGDEPILRYINVWV
ncbi:MAG: histidine phosphatase family protein [Actinomycetota bacterium]